MALDKQKILNELGSVVNQLQSADCGCMGNIFSHAPGGGQVYSNPSGGHPLPTCGGCRRGCCHGHGYATHATPHAAPHSAPHAASHAAPYAAPHAGEPYNMNHHCMGQCNPPKLYADTYNYLNQNLMQPVVKEVYNDLKSITPENTIMNSPIAESMGLRAGGGQNPASGMNPNMGGQQAVYQQQGGMGYQQMGNEQMNNPAVNNMQMGQPHMGNQHHGMNSEVGGMGPNILNMMAGDGKKGMSSLGNAGQPGQALGQQGGMPGSEGLNQQIVGNANMNMGMPNAGNQQMQNPAAQNAASPVNPFAQSISPNVQQDTGANYHLHPSNPAAQQMSRKNYGKHSQGMAKFNEMFPGVSSGDLGFDPMELAIQMNPANQQKVAMNTMQKLMTGEKGPKVMEDNVMAKLQPAIAGTNMASAALNPQVTDPQTTQNQQFATGNVPPQQQAYANNQPGQQQGYAGNQQQQAYTALTGAPTVNQGQLQTPQQQVQPAQQVVDPNTGAVIETPQTNSVAPGQVCDPSQQDTPTGYPPQISNADQLKESLYQGQMNQMGQPNYQIGKEEKHYEYNTLGQPVEVVPASLYNRPQYTNGPQTLSPQPVTSLRRDYMFANVKNTVSKTALMGNKPVGRTPSKSQLQRIYNQYKGSQSLTQQNIPPPIQTTSYSARNLNVAQNPSTPQATPVEKFGGDTVAVNQMALQDIPVKEPTAAQANPTPTINKPHGDVIPAVKPKAPVRKYEKLRNGLQDVVFTSYPSSQAWSFHGTK